MNWHIKNWFRIGTRISWKLSFYSLCTLLYFVPIFKNDFIYKFVKKKHEFILNMLNSVIHPENFNFINENPEEENTKNIWFLWWQGIENAPPIVKLCYTSLKKYAPNNAKIHFLSKENFSNYINVPDFIISKFEKGLMPIAVFTDYIRVCLIYKYGGLWVDSTILVSNMIPDKCFISDFYTLHNTPKKTPFVSDDKIFCFVLGGEKGSPFFKYIKEAKELYWKNFDILIDYYLLDYIIKLGEIKTEYISSCINNLEETSDTLYWIINNINKQYKQNLLEKYLSINTFSKLNWRKKIKIHKKYLSNYQMIEQILKATK